MGRVVSPWCMKACVCVCECVGMGVGWLCVCVCVRDPGGGCGFRGMVSA